MTTETREWTRREAKPYEPGNLAAKKHGALSPRTVAPIAEEMAELVVETAPWCAHPAFRAEVNAWAYAEARCQLLRSWLDEHGLLDDEGVPRPALAELHRAEAAAARSRQACGLNPASWAKLLAAFSGAAEDPEGTLEHLKAAGRRVIEARGAADA